MALVTSATLSKPSLLVALVTPASCRASVPVETVSLAKPDRQCPCEPGQLPGVGACDLEPATVVVTVAPE